MSAESGGSGRRQILKNVAWKTEKGLLFLDMSFLYQMYMEAGPNLFSLIAGNLEERRAYLCIEARGAQDSEEQWETVAPMIARYELSCYLLTEKSVASVESCDWAEFVLESPGVELKTVLWAHFLKEYEVHSSVRADSLASRYTLNAGEIRRVLATAALYAVSRGSEVLCEEDLVKSVRVHNKGNLSLYAKRVPLSYSLEDMAVGESASRGIRDICSQVRCRSVVGEQWGFYRRKAYGRGISVLFYGPPGTGKTMAAQGLARELGMDLYRVDLSRMMSKYIGETQKNISRLFAEAKQVQAILFFDEADALFSKRTEVKDSHDRGSNSEIAHLLQEMEEYEGISILATNLKDNMDGALKRRIKMIVPFEMPDRETRCLMWNRLLPEECPREEELHLDFFAQNFELPGSEIQDVLLGAAFMAASEGRRLADRHIIQALRNSYLKYGRALAEEEFRELRERKTYGNKGSAL